MKFFKIYFISIAVYSIVLILCLIPSSEIPDFKITNIDKAFHFIIGLTLSSVNFLGYSEWLKKTKPITGIFFLCLIIPVFFGGLIEILQGTIVSGRTGDWIDFHFDTLGSIAGFVMVLSFRKMLSKIRQE